MLSTIGCEFELNCVSFLDLGATHKCRELSSALTRIMRSSLHPED